MAALTEARHAGEFVLSEANGNRSREAVTIGESQTITPGTLLARVATAADVDATAAAAAGNTGDGVLTMADPAVSGAVKDGVYTLTCIEPASNAGEFEVADPSGAVVGVATVAVAFDGEIKFTIADGATDFAAGDRFTVTVVADAADFTWVAHAPTATDGTEVPASIALYAATTGSGESASISALARDAEVNGNILEWADSITAAEKADAKQALADVGIIVR